MGPMPLVHGGSKQTKEGANRLRREEIYYGYLNDKVKGWVKGYIYSVRQALAITEYQCIGHQSILPFTLSRSFCTPDGFFCTSDNTFYTNTNVCLQAGEIIVHDMWKEGGVRRQTRTKTTILLDPLLEHHRKRQRCGDDFYLSVCAMMLLVRIVPGLVTVSHHFHICIVSVIKRLLL